MVEGAVLLHENGEVPDIGQRTGDAVGLDRERVARIVAGIIVLPATRPGKPRLPIDTIRIAIAKKARTVAAIYDSFVAYHVRRMAPLRSRSKSAHGMPKSA